MTCRSPLGAPRTPAAPLPEERNRTPVSTPAGMRMRTEVFWLTRPSPLQVRHGRSMTLPAPEHRGQVWRIMMMPALRVTWPRPPQVWQGTVFEPFSAPPPLHGSQRIGLLKLSSFSVPVTASSRVISKSYRRFSPWVGPSSSPPPPPPPKNCSKMLPPPPPPPPPKTSRKMSPGSWKPPPPPRAPPAPARMRGSKAAWPY